MKQLLLYFLFFVGAAFVFVQCAKLFPSRRKPANLPVSKTRAQKSRPDSSSAFLSSPVGSKRLKSVLGSSVIQRYSDYSLYPWALVERYSKGLLFSDEDSNVHRNDKAFSPRFNVFSSRSYISYLPGSDNKKNADFLFSLNFNNPK